MKSANTIWRIVRRPGNVSSSFLFLFIIAVQPLSAATDTWSGAVNNNWSTGANWSPGVPANGDALVFPNTATTFTSLNDLTGLAPISLTIDSPTSYDISGNGLTFSSGSLTVNNTTGNGSHFISLPITITSGAAFTVTQNSTGLLVLAGPIGDTGGSGGVLQFNGPQTTALINFNSYSGGTVINGGTLAILDDASLGVSDGTTGTLTLAGGTLQVDGTSSSIRPVVMAGNAAIDVSGNNEIDMSGTFTGSGTLTKQGSGAVRITGSNSATTTPVTITNGLFAIDGVFSSVITVNGGTLGGNGMVVANVNNTAGTVAPGNSIGTLVIAGNYTQSSLGNFLVDIAPNGSSDLLIVSGTAALDGTITVNPLPGSYFANSTIDTILSAGTLSGQFSTLKVLDPYLQIGVFYPFPLNQVQIDILNNRFFLGTSITEYNPLHVDHYLESLVYFQNGLLIPSQTDLYNVILDITNLDPAGVTNALDQLHPAQFGAFEIVNSNVRSWIASIVNRHPAEVCSHRVECCTPCENMSLWMEPFGFFIDQHHVDDQLGFDASTGGLVLGGSYSFANNILLGLAGGGNGTYLKWDKSRGYAHIYSGFGSLYADWIWDRWYLETNLIAGWDYFDVKRHMQFSTINRTAKNNHHGYDINAHLGAAVDLYYCTFIVQPFVNADFSYLHQNRYKESGAQSLDLVVRHKNEYMLRMEEGLNFTKSCETDCGCWSAGIWLSYVCDIPIHRKNYVSSLVNQPGTFTVRSFREVSNRFSPGIDLAWKIDSSFSLAARYGAEIGPHFFAQKGDMRFEWGF